MIKVERDDNNKTSKMIKDNNILKAREEVERPDRDKEVESVMPEVTSVPRSNKRVKLKMGNGNGMLITNLGTIWKLLRPPWCPHPHAGLIEEVTERVRLSPTKDADLTP